MVLSTHDFSTFNLWSAYQSNIIYTAVLKSPSASDKNTRGEAVSQEQMLSLSMGCRLDTQPRSVENDVVCLQNGTVSEATSRTLRLETAEE